MGAGARIGVGRLTVGILLLMLVGIPLVAYLWETLNRLFAGILEPARLLIAVPILLVLVALLAVLSGVVRRLEGERRESVTGTDAKP